MDKSVSNIILGNPNANITITILTNPHCNPCERMHKRIQNLLKENGNEICIQYVFSSFSKELDDSYKHLIAIYLNHNIKLVERAFNEWFETGIVNKDLFFTKYKMDINRQNVESEYARHTDWKLKNNLNATPIVLVNGYKLPEQYKIEDIVYFSF